MMNSKERVCAALERRPVDRVPVFMWFHPATAQRLACLLDIPASRVSEAMGDDIRQTWVNNNYAMEGITHDHDGDGHTDEWGIQWVKQGDFNQIMEYPLAQSDPDQFIEYTFPHDQIDALVARMDSVAIHANEYYIGVDVSPCVFEMYCRLRGMELAALDLAIQPDIATVVMGKSAAFAAALAERACQRYPLDWLWTGDDVGGQQAMIMSPDMWRELIKPHLRKVIAIGKAHGLPVAYHSCGAVRPIIGDLIEIGVDVLNPIQCNCPGMDPLELKHEFGDQLAFMGGVDTQELLPGGTAAEVRRATARLIEGMTTGGGGFILAASHTVPPETPDENIFAMYEEAGISRTEILDNAAAIRRSL